MDNWQAMANASGKTLNIFAYGAWYGEDIPYLNQSSSSYHVPYYATGIGSTNAAILEDGSTTDPVRLFTTSGTGQIPVVLIIDEEVASSRNNPLEPRPTSGQVLMENWKMLCLQIHRPKLRQN